MTSHPSVHQTHSPIRLGIIITELEVGGAERCAVALAEGLSHLQFEPVVYSLAPRPRPGRDALVKQLESAGVPVFFAGARGPGNIWFAYRRLRQALSIQQPHIVQTFLFHANLLGSFAAWRAGTTCVMAGVRVADPRRWRQHLERRVFRRTERVVCVSQSVADYVRDAMRVERDKVCVIPNGIDLSRFPAQPLDLQPFGIPAGRRVATVVGRLDPQKGIDWLIEAAPALLNAVPDLEMLIVGDGPERQRWEARANELPGAGRVHFAGWRPDVPQILASSSLLLLPSRWEGMPNVVLEAMASGLPVVATKAEGVEELLGENAGSQTVEFGATDQLVACVTPLLKDPERGAELGGRNRQRVEATFALERMIQRYKELYDAAAHASFSP